MTLFAPTNDAISAASGVEITPDLLKYHAAAVKAASSGLSNEQLVTSMDENGDTVRINIYRKGQPDQVCACDT